MSSKKIPESVKELTNEFVSRMSQMYGERLNKVILYGSYARGDQHPDSDVDYLVVLNDNEIKTLREISALSTVTSILGLKYGLWISAIPFTLHKLLSGNAALGQNVKREGIVV